MRFKGFRSISEFESECEKHGQTTKRISFHRGDEKFFVLVTGLKHESPISVKVWHLFPADESKELMDGVINGHHANYLGKLAEHGFFPDVTDN